MAIHELADARARRDTGASARASVRAVTGWLWNSVITGGMM